MGYYNRDEGRDRVEVDSVEEGLAEASEEEAVADLTEKEDLSKCMMLYATNAERNAKFHLSRLETSLFFAVIAINKVVAQEADHLQEFLQSNSIKLTKNLTK